MSHLLNAGYTVTGTFSLYLTQAIPRQSCGHVCPVRIRVCLPDGKELSGTKAPVRAGCGEELRDMEQDPKEQAIVEWLKTVDKPLTTKERDKKSQAER